MSKISILLIYGGQGPGQVRKIKGEVSNVSRMIADFGPFFWNQGTGNTGGHQVNRGGQIASFQENLWFNVMLSKNMVDFMSEILPWLSFYAEAEEASWQARWDTHRKCGQRPIRYECMDAV